MNSQLFDRELYVTKIVLACSVKVRSGKHEHIDRPSHGFALHIGGEKIYRFADGTAITVRPGDVIYLPQFSDYYVDILEPGDCCAINFLLSETFRAEPFRVHVKTDDLLGCFKRAAREFRLQNSEQCCRELYEIICRIRQSMTEKDYLSPKQRAILDRADEYIAEHYTANAISLPALAAYCGASEVYLRTLFRSKYGVSPVEYVNGLRLSYARALLLSGECTVTDACFMSGFNDLSYFCRAYKRKYGFTPGDTGKADDAP